MRGLQLVEDGVDNRLRHDHVKIGQRLTRVAALERLGELVVVVQLLAGELAHAARGQARLQRGQVF